MPAPKTSEQFRRGFRLELDGTTGSRAAVDEKTRTVEICFSTETEEVERWFGIEKLDHSEGAVDLTRLVDAGPLLMDHSSRDLIGKVMEAWVGPDRRGRAKVRFSKSARASEIFQDVVDGIRTTISVGYQALETVLLEERESGPDVYLVKRWRPFEISFVSIPADTEAQVGRNLENDNSKPVPPAESSYKMNEQDYRAADSQRRQGIRTIAENMAHLFDAGDLARQFEENGRTVTEFQEAAMSRLKNVEAPAASAFGPEEGANLGLSDNEIRKFSIVRLVNAQLNNDWSGAGFERACGEAVAEKLGRTANGNFVPYDVLNFDFGKRDLSSTNGGGANLIGTDHMAGSFIEMLRNQSIIGSLGCTMLPGLTSDVDIPKQVGTNAGTWIDNENYSGADETNAAISVIHLSPKTLRIRTDLTRKMLKQSTPAIEAMIRTDLAMVSASMIDAAAISGSGSGAEPQGIIGADGVNVVGIDTNGGPLTHAHLVDMETALGNHQSLGKLAYVASTQLKGHMKKSPINAAGAVMGFLMGSDGKVNGHQCLVSNAMPDNLTKGTGTDLSGMIFGAWSSLLVGMWGGLDLEADRTTLGDRGGLVLRGFQDIDLGLRYPGAFSTIVDATN